MTKKMVVSRGWLAAFAASALLVVAGWLALTGAAQAAANSLSVSPAAATVAPGGTVEVTIAAEAPSGGLGGWTLNVTYDPAVVTPTASSGRSNVNLALGPDTIGISGFETSGLTGAVELAKITFTAAGAAGTSSDVDVSIATGGWTAPTGDPTTNPTITGGTITVAVPAATPTASASPVPATPTATVAKVPVVGGAPSSDGGSSVLPLVLAAVGLAAVAGAAWAVTRGRREIG
ncbi:MAG: cohesin domain-containing protein [Dehalococcoidia bacterium]|nr:cohesin domain-containing protein [Dehalococcoidia bacterium]